MKLRIGTRKSRLALWQANEVVRLLTAQRHDCSLVEIQTTGDKRVDVALATIGGKGLFIKELEEALLAGRIDLAVHSLKDVPSLLDETFVLASFLQRADPRDVLLHQTVSGIAALPPGSRVGTGSPRRAAQLLRQRPDLRIEPIRGNVPTRAARVTDGSLDAVILAAAGLDRLQMPPRAEQRLSIDEMIPAAGQGIVVLEALSERPDVIAAAQSIDVAASRMAAEMERGVLQRFGTRLDCYSCIAVHAALRDEDVTLSAFVSNSDGTRAVFHHQGGSLAAARTLIDQAHEALCRDGAMELLEEKP